MAATKPRISIMFEPESMDVLRRLSAVQGESISHIVADLVLTWTPVLGQLADVMEGALQAEVEVKQNLARLAEEQEAYLLPALESAAGEYVRAMAQIEQALNAEAGPADPRPVTRGSGDPRRGSRKHSRKGASS